MLLAAGRGERLRPLTDSIPKALVEVRGRPLLEYHLENLRRADVDTVVINLGWLGDQIVEHVGAGDQFGLNVIYSREGDNVLETGGGIHRALPLLGDRPFVVVNADIFTDLPLPAELADDALAHLVLVRTPVHREHGDFDLVNGRVANGPDRPWTFSGVSIYRREFFVDCEPGRFSVVPMLRDAADRRQLTGSIHDGFWEDVGTADRLNRVNRR